MSSFFLNKKYYYSDMHINTFLIKIINQKDPEKENGGYF